MNLAQTLFIVVLSSSVSTAANILGLLALPSPSHHIWNRSLMLALAARGHKVTVLATDAEKSPVPNYTEHITANAYSSFEFDIDDMADQSPFSWADMLDEANCMLCSTILSAEATRNLMKLVNSTTFDLIIADVTGVDCLMGFVHAFKNPPLIGVTAYSHPLWVSYMTGNPHNPSYVPDLCSPYSDHMSFQQRLMNTVYYLYSVYIQEWVHTAKIDTIAREYFGEDLPSIRDIRNNASLVMVNTQVGFDHPRPLVPAIVEVGGLHIGPSQPLPQHLKTPMDEAKEGFIYFSLGSNIRSDKLPANRRQVFLDAFSRLPYRVFWKWESESLPGQPSNVIVGKWMPQRDILAHPNIALFITHNGLLSTQEAIYNGVPIVGVPFFADQAVNSAKSMAHGFAERVDYLTVTADQLLETILKVIRNKRYKENARRLSQLVRDQPQTPLERAVFWTEYVIRHKGAPHLRSAAVDLPWYQYLLLDVLTVLSVGVLLVLLLVYKTCKVFVSLLCGGRKSQKLKKH